MKYLLSSIFIIITFNLLQAQDYQVTNMQGYVVETPKFSIANDITYLIFRTNTKLYKFPATGPQSPISNPIRFDPTFWGPNAVDIAAHGNNVFTIAYDYNSSGNNYVAKIGYSTNGGLDWNNFIVDTIQLGNWLPGRADLPQVMVSQQGNPYFFYWVFQNSSDTSGLYMYTFGMKKKLDKNIPRARYEYAVAPFVITLNNVDYIYVAYYIDSSYYLIYSNDGGNTFSQPKKLQTFWVMWPSDDWKPRFQIDNSNRLYFYYSYMDYGQPGQPPVDKMYHLVTYSDDWGLTWSEPVQIDTNFYDIDFRIVGDKFVKSYIDNENLYLQSSYDLLSWTNKIRVNSIDSSVAGGFETEVYGNKLAFAWKDKRTGNEEIFYRLMEVLTKVDENTIPINFVLYQNYPNPFNPSTTLEFDIPERTNVKLIIYDILGREVEKLVESELEPGKYKVNFNSKDLPSGLYFYALKTPKFTKTNKMLLIK